MAETGKGTEDFEIRKFDMRGARDEFGRARVYAAVTQNDPLEWTVFHRPDPDSPWPVMLIQVPSMERALETARALVLAYDAALAKASPWRPDTEER